MIEKIKQILIDKGLRLRVAESFTGGYLTSLITQIEGASGYLSESIICYSADSKIKRLNVNEKSIQIFGTVSAAILRQMLLGLLKEDGCDIAVATSGNASISNEKNTKKGDCFIGIGIKNNSSISIKIQRYSFTGTRKQIIKKGAKETLTLLINEIKQI